MIKCKKSEHFAVVEYDKEDVSNRIDQKMLRYLVQLCVAAWNYVFQRLRVAKLDLC